VGKISTYSCCAPSFQGPYYVLYLLLELWHAVGSKYRDCAHLWSLFGSVIQYRSVAKPAVYLRSSVITCSKKHLFANLSYVRSISDRRACIATLPLFRRVADPPELPSGVHAKRKNPVRIFFVKGEGLGSHWWRTRPDPSWTFKPAYTANFVYISIKLTGTGKYSRAQTSARWPHWIQKSCFTPKSGLLLSDCQIWWS